jgi:hypothetical protein
LTRGNGGEASPGWIQRDNSLPAFLRRSDKTNMYANEEAVRLQFALPDKIYLFFLDKALMNKLNGGNKHLVTATPIFFFNLVGRTIL